MMGPGLSVGVGERGVASAGCRQTLEVGPFRVVQFVVSPREASSVCIGHGVPPQLVENAEGRGSPVVVRANLGARYTVPRHGTQSLEMTSHAPSAASRDASRP